MTTSMAHAVTKVSCAYSKSMWIVGDSDPRPAKQIHWKEEMHGMSQRSWSRTLPSPWIQ
jgi:hypothetical protein